jgi:Spy/CpxP family protein refolding chaperone
MKEKCMLRKFALGLSIAAVLALAANLQAQGPGGPGGPGGFGRGGMGGPGGGGYLRLLQNEKVQKEIELVADQKQKLEALAKEAQEARRAKMGDMSKLSREEMQKKMEEVGKEMQEEVQKTQKKVEEILLPHQVERVKQIQLQSQLEMMPGMTLASPEVVKGLDLTEDQQAKIKTINEEAMKAMGDMRPGGGRPATDEEREKRKKAREEMDTKRKENNTKLMDVLTAEQKEKLEKMKGPKFDVTSLGGPGGPGGNRRGNRGNGNSGGDTPPVN